MATMYEKHSTHTRILLMGARREGRRWWQQLLSSSAVDQVSDRSSDMSTNSRSVIRLTTFGGIGQACGDAVGLKPPAAGKTPGFAGAKGIPGRGGGMVQPGWNVGSPARAAGDGNDPIPMQDWVSESCVGTEMV